MARGVKQWVFLSSMLFFIAMAPIQPVSSKELQNPQIENNLATHKALLHSNVKLASIVGTPTRVLLIGSSVAHGWKDTPGEGGYLHRSFRSLSTKTPTRYRVIDRAIPGRGVMTILDKYPAWLNTFHPNIVVISWGGLDDLYAKTPMAMFDSQIKWQIALALQHHADVFVITPPVSKASYTTYRFSQQDLMDNEMHVADNFNNPNVFVFNVFDQMKEYLRIHHQTYVPYMADGWHPNAAGHELAARILLKDMMQQFSVNPPTFKS